MLRFDSAREEEGLLASRKGLQQEQPGKKNFVCIGGVLVVCVVLGVLTSFFLHSRGSEPEPWLHEAGFQNGEEQQITQDHVAGHIADQAAHRRAVVDRISRKHSGDQHFSANPRFSSHTETSQSHSSFWRDIFGLLGTVGVSVSLLPQIHQIVKTRDAASFSTVSLFLCGGGCVAFGIFYGSSHAYGAAAICFWMSLNVILVLLMKVRLDSLQKDGSSTSLTGGWYDHNVL
mmetsp:Transcript_28667/g.67767  ORF Transcript_28667/g.67767 Transcript_28667/m.67767 type:complete len:231 (-) Transcript_28667:80-772(-)